jgi:hypothetical protein
MEKRLALMAQDGILSPGAEPPPIVNQRGLGLAGLNQK